MTALRILTFNWHEAYLCLLAKTGHIFTVVDKVKGGRRGWLEETRPVPANMRLLGVGSEEEARLQARSGAFDLAICHNLSDVAELAGVRIPKIVIFHNMLSTEIALFKAAGRPAPTKEQYVAQFRSLFDEQTSAVFISAIKQVDAEGIQGRVILPGIDLDEYGGYRGDIARVLRVGNFFTGRGIMLGQSVAAAALRDLPVTVLGINPEIPGSRLSNSWEDLKEHFRSHRVFLNTTVDGYEDGYNLAMLEAMATGMPVVSLPNRTSPITDGWNGFASDQPDRLHSRIEALLADPSLARQLGMGARETVAATFPVARFISEWNSTFDDILCRSSAPGVDRMQPKDGETAAVETEARDLVTRGCWSQARSLLEKKLEEFPDAPSLWKMAGFAYRNLGREPDALRAFWAAAKLDPGDEQAQRIFMGGLASIAPGAHPENNPEAAALACLCAGRGIDVGCGPNKTHPDAIGVDLVPAGAPGTAGGVKGLACVADVCASGDDLHMFADRELDYVVSRHNLEHYQDPLKALEEWKRVLKPGGVLALVLPDDTNVDTIHLDETHKHVFTPDSFGRLIRYLGDFEVIHISGLLRNWSFLAVLQKQGRPLGRLNYSEALSKAAAERCRTEARRREQHSEPAAALECWREASELDPDNPENLRGRVRMLRRLGRINESEALIEELNLRFPTSKPAARLLPGMEADPGMRRRRVLLAYCSNPVTTARYLERAFRKRHEVLTWGPAISDEIMKVWDLASIRHRVRPTDLGYDSPNVDEALKRRAPGWIPDLFLWIESGVPFPIEGLGALPCAKACYLIDTHLELPNDRRVDAHLEWARRFDVVFLAQQAYVERFRAAGLNAHWVPLGCDPDIHKEIRLPRVHPISFVGSLNHQRRIDLIGKLQSRFKVRTERCFLEEMSRVFSQSKIVFNNAVNNDLNMRVFEAMASGAFLLTDPAPGSGLEDFFQDGKHLAIYRSDDALLDVAERWLLDDTAREQVAAVGQAETLARHTYYQRMISMEEILFSSSARDEAGVGGPASAVDLPAEARALMTTRRRTDPSGSQEPPSLSDVEAKLGRGRILVSSGKFSEAEDHFRRWREQDLSACFPLLGLGCVELARGRWDEAERNFRLALKISPEEPNALRGLGLTLGNSGREMEATDALIRSVKMAPARVAILHALVRSAVTVGRFPEALEAIKNYMQHERATPELLFSCAALSARQGDNKEALSLLDRVEALQPSYPGLAACRTAWSR